VATREPGHPSPVATREPGHPPPAGTREPADLAPELLQLLAAVEDGRGTLGALASTPGEAKAVLAALSELEFRGLVRRTFGGRYERSA
jgi:hypothetical protein